MGSLHRHKTDHLLESLQKSHEANEVLRSDALVDHVNRLHERSENLFAETQKILNEAKRAQNLKVALEAIKAAANVTREARGNLHLLAELTGQLNEPERPLITVVLPTCEAHLDDMPDPVIDIALPTRSW
jgi:hypothetical protein